jgi:catechol 2,3-dioxygenase-like lactoylglutathione lyase family enzyme
MQYVTLEARSVREIATELRARGVAANWVGSDPRKQVLQLEDPAGDLIQVQEPWTPPATPSGAAEPFSEHLQHVGFAVDRSLAQATMAFYRDTLGWPEVVHMAGPDGRLALVKFRLPGPRSELIELIFFDPPLNKWAAGAFDHANFEVSDIDAAYRALHRGGIAAEAKNLPTVNGEGLWAINLIDPELTRIEVQVLAPTKTAIGTVSTVGAESNRER